MASHSPTEIRLQDLTALKQKADVFLLPETGKKSLTGIGNTYSPFKSRGLDFQEVRVYQPGDDIRQIDWHITAKYGKPFTKLYTEEKERTLFFVVDLRSNMYFATHGDFKAIMAARLTAFMASIADHQKDRIGYCILTDTGIISCDQPDMNLLPQLLHDLTHVNKRKQSAGDFTTLLQSIPQLISAGSFIFIFSDFSNWTETQSKLLIPLSEKNTILLGLLYDTLEVEIPMDTLPFSNGREIITITPQDKKIHKQFKTEWQQHQNYLRKTAHKYDWGFLPMATDSDYITTLCQFCFGEASHATGN